MHSPGEFLARLRGLVLRWRPERRKNPTNATEPRTGDDRGLSDAGATAALTLIVWRHNSRMLLGGHVEARELVAQDDTDRVGRLGPSP